VDNDAAIETVPSLPSASITPVSEPVPVEQAGINLATRRLHIW
jgi:hypothetical protein